jgi:hypothetical protein
MGYKVLTKQQWDSLPADKKYQMRYYSPDLYNYYQDRYVPKAEPVAEREEPTTTEKRRETFNAQGQVIYDRGDTFDRYTGEDLDNTDPSASVQDFMRGLGEYFDRLNVSKDIRETTTAFVLGLQGMERNLFEVGIRQVLEQLDTGAENINNPLNEGFIGGLEYLEEFAPSLYDYFNDMFGENETLSRSEVGDAFGISKEDLKTEAEESPAPAPVSRTINGPPTDEQRALAYRLFAQNNDRRMLNEIIEYDKEAAYIKETSESKEGTEDPKPATYKLPENEAVDVTELTEEQQTDIWDKIKEGLGKIPGAVGKVIFGPDGMPGSVDEWIEWVDKTLQAQMGPENLPFPIVITTNPNEGTWIDLKIPINLDVNGTPIRIPLFDEDGNFVSSEELGKAWVDAKGQIFGPLGEIGEIFLDDKGNIKLDLGELKDVLLEDLTLDPDGSITGSTVGEILIGKWFFNSETGEWEEEVEASLEEVGLDDGDEDGLADTTDGDTTASTDDDELGGLFEDEDEDEEQVLTEGPVLSEAPTGSTEPGSTRVVEPPYQPEEPVVVPPDAPVVVPPDAPVVVPPDAPVVVPPDAPVVVPPDAPVVVPPDAPVVVPPDAPVVVPPDAPVVVPPDAPVVVPPDAPVVVPPDAPVVVPPDAPVVVPPDAPVVVPPDAPVVVPPDAPVVVPPDAPVVVPPDAPVVVPPDAPVVVPPDAPVVVPPDAPVVVPPDAPVVVPPDEPVVVPPDEPVVIPPDEPVVVPPDEPVVIPPDEPVVVPPDGPPEEPLVGATGAGGAGGAAGRDAPRGGMMGGLSYNLPGFVEVQYQPKDYTVELNRIINESLFKGMI